MVLEVGLGGRYDSTNIIKSPLITAITNIGLDHIQVLGSTKESIAYDKAGIIKMDSHFFTTEDSANILPILNTECKKVGAEYHPIDVTGLDYDKRNKLLAGYICHDLGIIKDINDIEQIKAFPARFEIVEKDPIIIIDGAHNVSKIESTIHNLNNTKYNNLSVVIAISKDKDWQEMLKLILPKVNTLYVTRFSNMHRACVGIKDIVEFAKDYLPFDNIFYSSDQLGLFNKAKNNLKHGDALLVTGSFYLAGDIRSLYCPEEKILEQRNSEII